MTETPLTDLNRANEIIEGMRSLVDRLRLEAQCHAQEARTANATVAECYQAATGGTGEPGNWNGAEPVKQRIQGLEALVEQMTQALEPFAKMANFLDNTSKRRDAIYCGGSPGLCSEVVQGDYHNARDALKGYRETNDDA